MTADSIEKFAENTKYKNAEVNIRFKGRIAVTGVFIKSFDYEELKQKNFWRIISKDHVEMWEKTKNVNLTRLYNGLTFTRLSYAKES
ncbi:MAG TPA: short-chain dehydrogenase [Panacibacter sp.]|nr:short-chain dehydrogenase [Panacibacter sp.]